MPDPRQLSSRAAADTASAAATDVPGAVGRPSPDAAQRYVLGAEIARGGMGVIYCAIDTALTREVAVKVLRDTFAPDSDTARRFAAETRITAQLQHPGIPPVHDSGTLADGRPFLAMKLIKGCTLEELLRQRGDPAADRGRFMAVFEQLCQAVAYAHAHGVIHRDLKPANVMVGGFGEVQVMDWGLAKVLAEAPGPGAPAGDQGETVAATCIRPADGDVVDGSQTQAGSILGTLAYMAPEQAGGEIAVVDRRSDVFGLGATLCAILTGDPPYRGPGTEATRLQAIRGQLGDALARLDACGAEPELVALAKRCMAELPQRPADAAEVADAVARLRAAAEERARRAELDRAAAEVRTAEQRKRRRVWLALATALLLGATASVVFAVLARRAEGQAVVERDLKEKARAEAVVNEEKARTAEAARRVELGRTAAAAAQLAAGRGRWVEALKLYETALAAGGGDEIELRLGRYDCRMALGQLRPALAELDALAARPDLGRFAGQVLLRKAEIALGLQGGDDPRDLARRALDKGLPPADAAYARVFLVESAPEAIQLLQEARRLDPFHLRGLDSLAMLLFVTGRRNEFREAVAQLGLLRPNSATHLMSELFLRALDGDRAGAERLVRQFEKTDYAELTPLMRRILDVLVLAQADDFFFGGFSAWQLTGFMSEYARLAQHWSRMAGEKNAADAKLGGMRIFRLPMFRVLAETPPIKGLTTGGPLAVLAMLRQPEKMADVFGAAARAIPDGAFLLVHGSSLLQAGRLPEAEAAFRRSLESPSWANHRRAARFNLLRTQWLLANRPNAAAKERAAWREKALANVRALAFSREQPLPPVPTAALVNVASSCGDPALALALTEAALRKNPSDLALLGWKLDMELELRALDRAEATAQVVAARLQTGARQGRDGLDAFLNLARACHQAGRDRDALRWCDLVRERLQRAGTDPDLSDAWNALGVAYWQMKQLDQSIPIFERVYAARRKARGEGHPATLQAQINLGVNYRDAGRLKEAIPLLEEVDRRRRAEPSLAWVRRELLTAYIAARKAPQALKLVKDILAQARKEYPAGSIGLGGALTDGGYNLVQLGAWGEAEAVLRESLRIREKEQPDAWNTFNTRSLLGAALAGQEKYADARPLLVQGFEGLKARAAQIPEPVRALRLGEAADRLVRLYEAQGKKEEAAKWRKEAAAVRKP
jgi:tetratricopeptide (TPR) repeat protein